MLKNLNKRRNLLGTIYAIFMLMPLLSVLVTCLYVQFNKNAYESYYGSTINEQQYTQIDQITQFEQNKRYLFDTSTFNNRGESSKGAYARTIVYSNPTLINNNSSLTNVEQSSMIGLYITAEGYLSVRVFSDANTYQTVTIGPSQILQFEFTYVSNSLAIDFAYYKIFDEITYNKYSYLDNAFDYSIYRVTNGNTGNIDFTSTLFSFFLNSNEVNNLYIGFVNYYINYTLLVSCIYFLYLVLMWFITFIKNLIFRYMGE